MSSMFGPTPSATSGTILAVDVSADGEAFTGTFGDFQVEVHNGPGTPGMAARWEWFVLPLTETPQGDSITVGVSGFVVTEDAARATLVIGVNGHVTAEGFPPGTEREFVRSVRHVTSGFDREFRVAVGVLVEGDSATCSAASITISAVDAEIGLDAPEPAGTAAAAAQV